MDRPDWVSSSLFPAESRYFDGSDGVLHYVDEGTGEPLVLVHGTPTWSFLYRSTIGTLSSEFRVIAVDHLGFGLSDKPADAPYRPADHARRFAEFVDSLDLESMTLAVHDFGGPIALPYAIEHPDTVERLVLFNTWLWSLEDDRRIRLADFAASGVLGRLFYLRYNGSATVLFEAAWGERTPLTDEVHDHYKNPFPSPRERIAPWVLARELLGSTDWYERWWARRDSIAEKPTLVLWGLEDPAFGESSLERWERTLSDAAVVRLPDVGHFVPDEAADRVNEELAAFLANS
jgi:pimeloyl-ACP methyl ester carboxylesterase